MKVDFKFALALLLSSKGIYVTITLLRREQKGLLRFRRKDGLPL